MKTILAVDDSPSIRRMVALTIAEAGYRVIEAADGVEALEKAKSNSIHMVLTDQNMPNMDGFTLIKQLREMPAYRSVPIIVLTTEASDEMKARGKAVKATGWMVKPFEPATLVDIIRKVVG